MHYSCVRCEFLSDWYGHPATSQAHACVPLYFHLQSSQGQRGEVVYSNPTIHDCGNGEQPYPRFVECQAVVTRTPPSDTMDGTGDDAINSMPPCKFVGGLDGTGLIEP